MSATRALNAKHVCLKESQEALCAAQDEKNIDEPQTAVTIDSQESGTTELLARVSFTDTNHGMACGAFGIILRTTDGGETWLPESSGTDYDLSRISCTGTRDGTAVGYGGSILRREVIR